MILMNEKKYMEKKDQAIKAIELFELLSEDEKNQCLIYVSALADRAMMQREKEER